MGDGVFATSSLSPQTVRMLGASRWLQALSKDDARLVVDTAIERCFAPND